jgi:SAM-dependent methyltransferase
LPGNFHASECGDCGLWFQNPRPRAEDLHRLYPPDYSPHARPNGGVVTPLTAAFLARELGYPALKADRGTRPRWFERLGGAPYQRWRAHLELIPAWVPDGTLLEIGCASGSRLLRLRRLGWSRLWGIELVPAPAREAQSEGFDVYCGPVETGIERFADGTLDVVITSMVLEHLLNPFAVTEAISRKLRPGGQFLFSTVLRDSADARRYGGDWGGFDFPRHMVYFSYGDVVRLLQADFDRIESAFQPAFVDWSRPSAWRIRERRGRWSDRAIVAVGRTPLGTALGHILAWKRRSARVCFRCVRKQAGT